MARFRRRGVHRRSPLTILHFQLTGHPWKVGDDRRKPFTCLNLPFVGQMEPLADELAFADNCAVE